MSHKHEQVLRSIFHDPAPNNLHWREVESLLKHVGAELENVAGTKLRVKIGKVETVLHRPHHSNELDRQGIKFLREFLGHAGISPSTLEALNTQASE